jgi:hypothetical protein
MAGTEQDCLEVRSTDIGALGILHLKRLWASTPPENKGRTQREEHQNEGHITQFVLDGLELGMIETFQFLMRPGVTFADFEEWVLKKHEGHIPPETKAKINRAVTNYLTGRHNTYPIPSKTIDPVFHRDDWACWHKNGYVVLRNAIPREDCAALEQAIWEGLGMRPDEPGAWRARDEIFWVNDFRHPIMDKNRRSERIHRAFAEIWGTDELFHSVDRLSFNPPLGEEHRQFGPSNLHWDASIVQPMPFDVLGLLYLNDVEENQGAFQCVPGFHHKIEAWLRTLPEDADPRTEILHAFDTVRISGQAGDLIIWRQELPHGSSVNRGSYPRFAQYMAMYPADRAINPVWK